MAERRRLPEWAPAKGPAAIRMRFASPLATSGNHRASASVICPSRAAILSAGAWERTRSYFGSPIHHRQRPQPPKTASDNGPPGAWVKEPTSNNTPVASANAQISPVKPARMPSHWPRGGARRTRRNRKLRTYLPNNGAMAPPPHPNAYAGSIPRTAADGRNISNRNLARHPDQHVLATPASGS